MQLKGLFIITAVTSVFVALALLLARPTGPATRAPAGPLIERFDASETASITIATAARTFTIAGPADDRDAWTIDALNGYPASSAKIDRLLEQIAELKADEPKTALPEFHTRIGLVDPTDIPAAEAEPDPAALAGYGIRIDAKDAAGQKIAGLIVGQAVPGTDGGFVRLPSEDQAWLTTSAIGLPPDPVRWITQPAIGIPRADVQRVTITHPSGESLIIEQSTDGRGRAQFAYTNPPAGMIADPVRGSPELTAGALGSVSVTEIMPAADAPIPESTAVRVTFETVEGAVLTLRLATEIRREAGGFRRWLAVDEISGPIDATASRARGWAFAIPASTHSHLTRLPRDLAVTAPEPQGPVAPDEPNPQPENPA